MHPKLKSFSEDIAREKFGQYYINHGGCAKAACEFYKYLKNIDGVTLRGGMTLNSKGYKTPKKSLRKITKNPYTIIDYCHHVVLAFSYENKEYIIDAVDGVVPKEKYLATNKYGKNNTGYLNIKLLREVAYHPEGWNTRFDKRNIKHLRTFLKNYGF